MRALGEAKAAAQPSREAGWRRMPKPKPNHERIGSHDKIMDQCGNHTFYTCTVWHKNPMGTCMAYADNSYGNAYATQLYL